ncbi:T9SS type A sorting domain-containing protein [Psychroflexus sp. CAK8W]|uniref:T9SS type A sorting domain-containing protein n=1 Tax=Psychroflexus longus TaxID=2873596 RepID=A0ABS7XHB9_9FLAO|nr:T9SS type A sorting domain-containing protein [Psychroflexus longus]MBZ9778342.1 T9SS type A sorting domain-containing protein [Psychroflexus longus]
MNKKLLFIYILSFSISGFAQSFENECECSVVINGPNDNLPGNGNNYDNTEEQTICIKNNGNNYTYKLEPKGNKRFYKLGNNVTFCIDYGITFVIENIDFQGSKKIYNRGELNILDESLSGARIYSKNGKIIFSGNQEQDIAFIGNTEIKSLIIDNPSNVKLVNGNIDIYKNIELLNGNLITNYSGIAPEENLITFKSDSTRTAILKEVVGSSRIIGAVRIERYLPSSNRAYRYLSSSVNTTGSIRDNWQENVNNTDNNYNSNKNPNPGYGTHITGSKQGNKGFDASLTGNPSLFTWNINSGNWLAISNTDQNTLEAGKAYSILIRGDRSTNIYSSNSAYTGSTTLRSTGEIVTGDVDLSHELNKTPNGFSLIGNPYQAQVDFKRAMTESSSNLKRNFYYAWTPALQTRGGYVTVDLSSEPVEYVPSGKNLNSNKQDNYRYIQPNQSVFIETAPSASEQNQPSLVFKEKHKTDNSISNEVFSIPEQIGKIDLTLIRKKGSQIVDGVRFKFNNNYDNEVNQNDATKVWNNEESFSILSNQANYLAIEKRQYPEIGEKLKFWIGNYTSQDYTMLVSLTEIEGYEVYIKDNYTGDILKLDDGDNKFDFNVDSSISESSSSDRFEITFEPVTLGTENIEAENNFKLYPNPSSTGAVYIKYDAILGNEIETEVYSMIGKRMKVTSNRVSNSEVKLNTSSLSTGIYLVKLSNGSYTTTKKLVINN